PQPAATPTLSLPDALPICSAPGRVTGTRPDVSMTTVLFADNDFPDIELERALFDDAGVELAIAQCKTEDEVVAHGRGCRAILLQDRKSTRLNSSHVAISYA